MKLADQILKSTARPYRPEQSRIVLSTEARGLTSLPVIRSRMTPAKEREQAETVSVALNGPHRHGNSDRRAGTPLYDVWAALRLRDELYDAGERYGEIVHQDRVARGLGARATVGDGLSCGKTEAELAAIREAAQMKRDEADYVLRGVDRHRGISVMVSLCVDQLPYFYEDMPLIRRSLWALATHLGLVKEFHEGRAY